MKRKELRAGTRSSDSRGPSKQPGHRISQLEILRLFWPRVGRLADPLTELEALKEILREVRRVTGQQEQADQLFFQAKNFFDGLLQGFDWGWRAAKWIQPKKITDVDWFIMRKLLRNPNLSNDVICRSLDRKVSQYDAKLNVLKLSGKTTEREAEEFERNRPKLKLSDKLNGRNLKQVKSALGKDEVLWLWQTALPRVHAVEVTLSDLRNDVKKYKDALWWHEAASKHFRKHGHLDWARRSAVIKKAIKTQGSLRMVND